MTQNCFTSFIRQCCPSSSYGFELLYIFSSHFQPQVCRRQASYMSVRQRHTEIQKIEMFKLVTYLQLLQTYAIFN